MARMINVSTDVFAAIWARRQPGEATEDAVLRRVLECPPATQSEASVKNEPCPQMNLGPGGVYDKRNDVLFPEGFVAFRTYKGRRFEAIAQRGQWVRTDTGQKYPTLNQLDASISQAPNNVWNGSWRYREKVGSESSIEVLRLRFLGESASENSARA